MTARIGKVRLTTKAGRTVIDVPKPRLAVGQRRNAEGKASRLAKAWKTKSKDRT
jgi:hypothetical protein